MKTLKTILAAAILVATLIGCATNTRYEPEPVRNTYTIEKDMCQYWKMGCVNIDEE